MTPEYWQKVKNILENALEFSGAERSDFLEKSCKGDKDLRRDVENLLVFEKPDSDLLEKNVVSFVFEKHSAGNHQIGQQIGNYKIIGELGAGGMGAVFLAERADGEFSQRVALKLIKSGMDSEMVLRRFFNERQILASLEHPNIARLIDGGTTADSLPFFVLEYVEGANIIEYSDKQNLDLNEKLRLFLDVCEAVQYAHQNLVIHRDLKPSNILVTKESTAKLLDFGIAKLLNSKDSLQTAAHFQIFTPEYASPEQVKGEKLTTATDVYSLGVILYELLTGMRPYKTDSGNIGDIIKAVCESEPLRPSSALSNSEHGYKFQTENSVSNPQRSKTKDQNHKTNPKSKIQNSKLLKGDLDNIILKALRKEPERRYASVEQFAEDIRRHQAGLPVTASKDTWNYRASKFINRNRLKVAAAVLILLSLIGGLAATLWQNRIARQERERAERRSENLRKISNSMVSEIERAIRDLPGAMPARKLLLARAVEQLDALAAESEGDTKLQLELAWAYQNLRHLPDRKLSERQLISEKAVALTKKVIQVEPSNLAARDRLAMIYLDMIFDSRLGGDVNFTLDYNRRAVSIVDEILRESPDEIEYQDSFWTANYHYALTMQQLGRADETIETARKILPVAEKMYQTNTDGYDYMKPHLTRTAIGYGLNYKGDYAAAIKEFETALGECRAEQIKKPDADILRRNEANILLQLASALENSGDVQTALNHAETALKIRTKLAAANPTDFDYTLAVADGEVIYAQIIWRQNQKAETTNRFRRALEIYEKIINFDSERIQTKILAARTRMLLGTALIFERKRDEGLQNLREAVRFYESIDAENSTDSHLKRFFAEARARLADALVKDLKTAVEAHENYRQSLEIWQNLQSQGTLRHADLAQLEGILAKINANN